MMTLSRVHQFLWCVTCRSSKAQKLKSQCRVVAVIMGLVEIQCKHTTELPLSLADSGFGIPHGRLPATGS